MQYAHTSDAKPFNLRKTWTHPITSQTHMGMEVRSPENLAALGHIGCIARSFMAIAWKRCRMKARKAITSFLLCCLRLGKDKSLKNEYKC